MFALLDGLLLSRDSLEIVITTVAGQYRRAIH